MHVNERIEPVKRRCQSFFKAQTPGHFLVRVAVPAAGPPMPPLSSFNLDTQLEEYLEHTLAAALPGFAAREGLDDDSVPCLCPRFGIAEHSAFVGTPVHLQEQTCLPDPIIHDWSDLDRLRLSEDAPWFGYMKRGYQYLRSRAEGRFVLGVRGTEMPMDLANALRGDELFMDFLTEPEQVHRLMAFCVKALRWYFPHLQSWSDSFDGGHFLYYNHSWVGPNALGHVSNDAAMLCSTRVYEEFGFPYELQMLEGYGGVFYHLHTQKMHFTPRVAQLPRIFFLEMTPDPRCPPPIENLDFIFAHTGTAPLIVYGTARQVYDNIEKLKERNAFITVHCSDRAEAQEALRFVRSQSKPFE